MAHAQVCATDDRGKDVCLDNPAERIISLSPGATELLFAAGAGDDVAGVVNYSDYPEAAKELPIIGSLKRLDVERILSLSPDLVIVWVTGNPKEQTERLEELDLTLYYLEPRDFKGIASAIERLSTLAGTEEVGHREADRFRAGIESLRDEYGDAAPVPVFYQVWDQPLMTVNGEHFIHEVIELCGGENVYSELDRLVPRIDRESVLSRNPEAIVAGGMGEENRDWLEEWKEYDSLTATERGNLFFVPPSTLQRPTPRLLEGGATLCEKLETARERR
ncbi:cobalamin-binding protein [Halovibrio salipaludis]|uniref:Cobalamin-binding protein n=2 Tax=Halovibrio salipaludis TaxID=2032626 RepID=A0A2A2FAQ0_9GAMM|nr:cobalamin-binding protein [Halovibrio salipaludis]PAU82516.1 cobalamin-binding protein [Halovibrio salipaludis]